MAKALAAIEARALTNIRLHHGDATELLAWLPAASLARVDLLYPDPWPKRRHWKRRFVQDESVAGDRTRSANPAANSASPATFPIMRPGRWCGSCARPISSGPAERADDWRMPWPGFDRTRYEAKAKREGRSPAI